jgi:hypothetical protein
LLLFQIAGFEAIRIRDLAILSVFPDPLPPYSTLYRICLVMSGATIGGSSNFIASRKTPGSAGEAAEV